MIDNFDSGKYSFLSNFYDSEVMYEGKVYPTSEHMFQAYKAKDIEMRSWVRNAPGPGIAKSRGQRVDMRDDWKEIRQMIMSKAVKLKFQQNAEIMELLIDTGDQLLIEGNTWHDNIWGDCYCPRCTDIEGQNLLGKILMEVREEMGAFRLKEQTLEWELAEKEEDERNNLIRKGDK